jgi:aspartate racemase
MGPWATAKFLEMIVNFTEAEKDADHINSIILNHSTITNRVQAIQENRLDEFVSEINADIKFLENADVSYMALPCNGSHMVYEEMQNSTAIEILHMPRETVKFIKQVSPNIKKIGLLATYATIKSKVYENELITNGMEIILPDEKDQQIIMDIIYNQIKKGKDGNLSSLLSVVENLKQKGAEQIILGCTELSWFTDRYAMDQHYTDSMQILAKTCIVKMGYKLKV